jgi:hypothetical protein
MKLDRGRWILVATVVAGFLCTLVGVASRVFGQEADRKKYADKVRETYNFRFGKDQPFIPGTKATTSFSRAPFPTPATAPIATRRLTTNGARRCTRTPSVHPSTGRA